MASTALILAPKLNVSNNRKTSRVEDAQSRQYKTHVDQFIPVPESPTHQDVLQENRHKRRFQLETRKKTERGPRSIIENDVIF